MITDNEAIKAMNTLTDYCKHTICRECSVMEKCLSVREGNTFLFGGHLALIGIIEAKELASNMAAAIMNRKD